VWFMFINSTIVGMVYVSFFVMGIDLLQRTRPNPPTSDDFDRLYIVLTIFGNINVSILPFGLPPVDLFGSSSFSVMASLCGVLGFSIPVTKKSEAFLHCV